MGSKLKRLFRPDSFTLYKRRKSHLDMLDGRISTLQEAISYAESRWPDFVYIMKMELDWKMQERDNLLSIINKTKWWDYDNRK